MNENKQKQNHYDKNKLDKSKDTTQPKKDESKHKNIQDHPEEQHSG